MSEELYIGGAVIIGTVGLCVIPIIGLLLNNGLIAGVSIIATPVVAILWVIVLSITETINVYKEKEA